MTNEQMREIARGAIERHLGDVTSKPADSIYDDAFCLAHGALMDAGVDAVQACSVARKVAQEIAQP